MEKKETTTAGGRKAYARKGERAQKMFNFRLDLDHWEWLQQQPNKGRYLNELIAADRKAQGA